MAKTARPASAQRQAQAENIPGKSLSATKHRAIRQARRIRSAQPGALAAYDGRRYLGSVITRAHGFAALTPAGRFVGVFPTRSDALDALNEKPAAGFETATGSHEPDAHEGDSERTNVQ
jgi:hypothetical protein